MDALRPASDILFLPSLRFRFCRNWNCEHVSSFHASSYRGTNALAVSVVKEEVQKAIDMVRMGYYFATQMFATLSTWAFLVIEKREAILCC